MVLGATTRGPARASDRNFSSEPCCTAVAMPKPRRPTVVPWRERCRWPAQKLWRRCDQSQVAACLQKLPCRRQANPCAHATGSPSGLTRACGSLQVPGIEQEDQKGGRREKRGFWGSPRLRRARVTRILMQQRDDLAGGSASPQILFSPFCPSILPVKKSRTVYLLT